jgi:hypothetical protein
MMTYGGCLTAKRGLMAARMKRLRTRIDSADAVPSGVAIEELEPPDEEIEAACANLETHFTVAARSNPSNGRPP